MERFKLSDFTKGWIVGDFLPSIIKTDQFEFALKKYQAGDRESKHVHKIAREITVIVSGVFLLNLEILTEGDILVLNPGEPAQFQCLKEGYTAVIKTPSVKNDKYILN